MNNENENQEEGVKRAESSSLEVFKDATPALAPSIDDFSTIQGAVDQLDNMTKLAEVYIKGGLSPIKSVSDFVVAVITGNQLGLPYTVSINNIFPINGKPGMSVHLIRALVLQKGVTFEKTKDYLPIHNFYLTVVGEDGKRTVKKDGGGQPVLGGTLPYDQIDKEVYMVDPKPADRVTEYKLNRLVKLPNGAFKEQTAIASFSLKDALQADLLDKDNWKKYPASMLDARAFMKGAREVASDIIFGLYSIDELADTNDVPYTMDESFNTRIINVEAE